MINNYFAWSNLHFVYIITINTTISKVILPLGYIFIENMFCAFRNTETGEFDGLVFTYIPETYKKKQLDGDDNIQSMAALKWTTAEFRVVSK